MEQGIFFFATISGQVLVSAHPSVSWGIGGSSFPTDAGPSHSSVQWALEGYSPELKQPELTAYHTPLTSNVDTDEMARSMLNIHFMILLSWVKSIR
jgi:hypothetical protein